LSIQDDIETKIYGMKSFGKHGEPRSMLEAAERGVYCLANSMRSDAGSPLYGDVSAVFRNDLLRDRAIISAIDTGEWSALCNYSSRDSSQSWPPYQTNCSAYNFTLGTLDWFDHLILYSLNYWKSSPDEFARRVVLLIQPQDQSRLQLQPADLYTYFEVMPVTKLQFPTAVKFVLGEFPALFGTKNGAKLQALCMKMGWLLVWTLGLNLNQPINFFNVLKFKDSLNNYHRLIDPLVLMNTTVCHNMSDLNVSTVSFPFRQTWKYVEEQRKQKNMTNSSFVHIWSQMRKDLPDELALNYLHSEFCGNTNRCVGVSGTGNCVCYSPDQPSY